MRISRVRLRGFRSLQECDIELVNYNTLIGKNDSGKSSFIGAIQALLDPSFTLKPEDLCRIEGHGDECSVEAVLEDCAHALAVDGKLTVRRTLGNGLQYEGLVPEHKILEQMSIGRAVKSEIRDDTTLSKVAKDFLTASLLEVSPAGAVKPDQAKEVYKRMLDAGHVTFERGWCPLDSQDLSSIVQVIMLSADVRGEDELRDTGKSVLNQVGGLLLREATKGHHGINQALSDLQREIGEVTRKDQNNQWIFPRLNDFETFLSEEIRRFDGTVKAESTVIPPRVPSVDFTIKVEISDGFVSELDKMGHGLRRSVVFAMLRTHRRLKQANSRNGDSAASFDPLYLFLVEEPELYLHPQAERRRMAELKELSNDDNAQVILCTHSAIFVDLADYKGIHRFSRPGRQATNVKSWTGADLDTDPAKTISLTNRFNVYRSAMVFADLVILVEGVSEQAAIPFIAEKLGLTTPDVDVEIVSCDGNGNIPPYQSILEGLGIRYVAWLDSDDKGPIEEAKRIRSAALGKVITTARDWERMNGLSTKGKDKVYRSWKHFIFDGAQPRQALIDRITAAYNWRDFE